MSLYKCCSTSALSAVFKANERIVATTHDVEQKRRIGPGSLENIIYEIQDLVESTDKITPAAGEDEHFKQSLLALKSSFLDLVHAIAQDGGKKTGINEAHLTSFVARGQKQWERMYAFIQRRDPGVSHAEHNDFSAMSAASIEVFAKQRR